jgi:hypothetical protein
MDLGIVSKCRADLPLQPNRAGFLKNQKCFFLEIKKKNQIIKVDFFGNNQIENKNSGSVRL